MEESVLQPLPVRLAPPALRAGLRFRSEVHISQEQLGVFVGAARESVNRQLQLWRKDGILDLQRGRILLQNMTKLTAVATERVAEHLPALTLGRTFAAPLCPFQQRLDCSTRRACGTSIVEALMPLRGSLG